MSPFRAGFWKDYVAVIVATVILGAGAAAAGAAALDAALGRAVTGLLGEEGQYDLVVHVREHSRDAAAAELARLLEADWPGAAVSAGVTVAGSSNFFITLPDELKTQSTLERLAASLAGLPGFNGYAWMLEPGVTVSGLRPGVRDMLAQEAASWPGVRAAVRHGGSVTLLLDRAERRRPVTEALQQRLAGRHVLEVRWAAGAAVDEEAALRALADGLRPRTLRDVTDRSGGGEPWEALARRLRELLPVWRRLAETGAAAADAAETLMRVLDAMEPAFALTETPEEQGRRLSAAVQGEGGADAVRQALIRVFAANLVRAVGGEDGAGPAPGELPPREQLEQLRTALAALAQDAAPLREAAREDVAAALDALEELLPEEPAAGRVLELWTDQEVTPGAVARVLREAFGYEAAVFASGSGFVRPNPRGVAEELLADVRRAVAGLLAVAAGLAALVLDHATVFAALSRFAAGRRRRAALAAGVGAAVVGGTYALSGGGLPFVGAGAAAALGAGLGLLVMALAERISPVDDDEILAGMALGLSGGQIMREIVAPAGRPGLLTLLNSRRRRFR